MFIDRKAIHLGEFGSKESKAKYKRLIAQWSAKLPVEVPANARTVAEVLEAYRTWAEAFYGDVPRGRYRNLLPTIRTVRELYADLPADQFTPKKLKTVRQAFIDSGNGRTHVNTCTRRVIAIFAWAAEEELVPGSLVHSLREVRSLERGRGGVSEGKPVQTIDQTTVDVTLTELTTVVADMVRLQLVSGARPGEICNLTPEQIDRSDDVWYYRPVQHKNVHRGKDRVVCFGPRAQEILTKYLLRPNDQPCFSPREAMRQRFEQREQNRKTPFSCGNRSKPGQRCRRIEQVREGYDAMSYRRSIHRAFPAPDGTEGKTLRRWKSEHRWSPNRLRHTKATQVREQFGSPRRTPFAD